MNDAYHCVMKYPIENLTSLEFTNVTERPGSIFLAGPCPREDFDSDWRIEAEKILDSLGFKGVIFNPTNKHFKELISKLNGDKERARAMQVQWERRAMHYASVIVFWIPRSEKLPARTTNYEFGEWYKKPGTVFGWPDDSIHNEYPGLKLREQKRDHFKTLEDTLKAAVELIGGRDPNVFFTSDTHFGQQRTLELSRRPFVDVEEMDLTMISNWNKTVTNNDVVFHAGDFCDPDNLPLLQRLLLSLNFSELNWTLGNYDRKIKNEIVKIVNSISSLRKIRLYDNTQNEFAKISHAGHNYVVVHEPCDFEYDVKDHLFLYGHIHGRAFAKRNGFDLAADYHQYTPISIDDVAWFTNAMRYWDENVYTDRVNPGKHQ